MVSNVMGAARTLAGSPSPPLGTAPIARLRSATEGSGSVIPDLLASPVRDLDLAGDAFGDVLNRQLRFRITHAPTGTGVVAETGAALDLLEPPGRADRLTALVRGWIELVPSRDRGRPVSLTVITGETPPDRMRGNRATMLANMFQRQQHLVEVVSGTRGARSADRMLSALDGIGGSPLSTEALPAASASQGHVRFADAAAFVEMLDRGRVSTTRNAEYVHIWRHELEHMLQPAFATRSGRLFEGAAENVARRPGELERTASALGMQVTSEEAAHFRAALKSHPYDEQAAYTAGVLEMGGTPSDPLSIARDAGRVFHATRDATVMNRLAGRIAAWNGIDKRHLPRIAEVLETTPVERSQLAVVREEIARLRS